MVTGARRRGYKPREAWRWPLRRASLVGIVCAWIGVLSFGNLPARAQPETVRPPISSEPPATDRTNSEATFQERTPQIIYAPDAQGNPVPLINVPLERIQELLDQADGILEQQQPPRFQLNRLAIDGQATEDRATFDAQITITTITDSQSDSGWISIPLKFHEAVLRAPPVYEGAGQLLLVYDSARGYVAWIQQPDRGEHRIQLRFDVGLSHIAQTTQLRFYPPLANISQFSLQVPGSQISADLQNGQDLQVQPTEGAGWRLTARDLQNEVVLVWRDGGRLVREQPVQLDVRGDIRVMIDGPGAIRTELALDLQSYNRPVESFLLRLPPHTTLVTGNTQGYEVSDLTDPEAVDREDRQTVQITLQKPATQARLQLTAQSNAQTNPSDQLDVANYEVRDALRQSGQVSLWASEDWLVDWSMGSAVRRVTGVDRVEGSEERRQLATFEYFRQPCDLKVQVAPQGTRKEVEPFYTMRINEDRVTLEARLRYRIRGARESFLEFDRNDWQLDDVGPAGEVEVDNWDEETPARVQLKLKRPASGELEVVLTLHRRITQPQGKLDFPLPWPVADTTTGGLLIVRAASAIELDYRLAEMPWLIQDVVPEEQLLPSPRTETDQELAAFRFRSDRAMGNVSIDYEVRPQEITVRADTELELTADRADVEQRFAYRIRYQPATRLTLDFPRKLIEHLSDRRNRNQITFEVDGESLEVDALFDAALAAESTQPIVPITVPLPYLKLGTVEVSLAYPWSIRSASSEDPISVLLASPRDGRIVANTATLTPIGPLRVQAVTETGFWSSDAGANRSDPRQAILLSSASRPSQISLFVRPQQEPRDGSIPPGATLVRRAWQQSWLGREERLDRLVYQVATGAERLTLQLPPGVDAANVVTLVDGVEVTPRAAGQELTVPLDRRPGGEHTLEVSLPFTSRPRWGWMRFSLPKLLDSTPPQRWFWQLVLPADEHLLVDDPQSTAAHRWIQSGWFWRRETPNAQRTLEQWTKASQQPLLPEGTNRYLYSSFESLDQLQVYTCPRRLLIFGSSAALLLMGLTLIYVRWLRHPLTLLLLALGILALAWRFPATAVLIAQASVLGGICGLIALLLAAVLQPRPHGPVSAAPSGSSRSDSRSGGVPIWPERAGTLSTATAPSAAVPEPVSDGDL